MEDNINIITDEDFAAFDDDWGDEAPVVEVDDSLEDATEPEAEGDTQPEEAEEEAEPEEESSGDEPAEETIGEKPQTFKLKHLKEEKEYSLDDVIAFAQKGLDYDGIRSERDTLRTSSKAYEAFLTELAKRSGAADIQEQMTRTRAVWVKADEAEKGNKISDADAILLAQKALKDEAEQVKADGADQEETAEPEKKADNSTMFLEFVKEFPDVKPEDIPQSVWNEFSKSGDLIGAYSKYENAQLRSKMKTLERNKKNEERSTGSRKSKGAATPKDDFDDAWDSI